MTWQSIEKSLQTQLITMRDSSEIRLPEGNFMFANSLLLDDKHFVTIQGAGIDKTVLSFAQQQSGAEGLKISNCSNIRLKDLTIEDAKGDNIKVTDTYGIEFDGVKSHWNGEPKEENGAYAFYPVLCKNVVIQNCIAAGASDAGIYVGQSDSVTIRYNKVYYNVAGIESENSRWVEIHGNEAFKNTGGILIFDLPGLTQLGHTTRVFNNVMEENNYKNFAPEGNIVAAVPPGTGMMLLATRDIEIFDNQFINNRTSGLAIASYDLVSAMSTEEGSQLNNNIETARQDASYDPYPTGIYVHSNSFENGKLLPTTQNEFGLLFMMKFPFGTPDIVWDGIAPDRESFEFCLENNGEFKFADLDAANDFESLNTDWVAFNCRGTNINPIF
ncbi:MAG: parallel beta-helix domain-containing protein [Bacteroidota bacterium]